MAAELGWLREYLSDLDYPLSREDLIRLAEEQGAGTETLDALRSLPAAFSSFDELALAVDHLDQA